MPAVRYLKTKPLQIEKAKKSLGAVSKLFTGECVTAKEFSKAVCVTPPTAKDRLDHPEKLSLLELITASVNLGFSGSVTLENGETRVEVRW